MIESERPGFNNSLNEQNNGTTYIQLSDIPVDQVVVWEIIHCHNG